MELNRNRFRTSPSLLFRLVTVRSNRACLNLDKYFCAVLSVILLKKLVSKFIIFNEICIYLCLSTKIKCILFFILKNTLPWQVQPNCNNTIEIISQFNLLEVEIKEILNWYGAMLGPPNEICLINPTMVCFVADRHNRH